MESFGQANHKWLKRILELPNGIPAHDTFAQVFARLDPEQFQQCFLRWVRSVVQLSGGQVIAIDGKTLRQSYDTGESKAAIHMVSAWATQTRLVLGQTKVAENLAVVRHIALNLLTQETTLKLGIKNKRLQAGWDEDYLLKVLLQ